jgi:hypothetical protein
LECEIAGRGGGKGGGIGIDAGERFRRGKGSEFPFISISPAILYGRRFVIEVDFRGKVPVDAVNIVSVLNFRLIANFFGNIGN